MKKNLFLYAFILVGLQAFTQTTITLQPGSSGFDAHIDDYTPNGNFEPYPNINAGYNTVGGTPTLSRNFIKFDLSSIPAGATILSAKLSLYHGSGTHSASTANEQVLAKVNANWDEATITWNNQPAISVTDTVQIGNTNTSTDDKLDINLLGFVQGWVSNSATNFGMVMMLQDEPGTLGRFQTYASSDFADSTKRPKLVVTYEACTGSTVLQPGSSGFDAHVDDYTPNDNFEPYPNINSGYNTVGGTPTLSRNFIKFDLSSIPAGATILNAKLSLYHGSGTHSASTANEEVLAKVNADWDEATITWNNQPAFSSRDTVHIGNTNTSTDDKLDINLLGFVQSWVNNASTNFGVVMMLQDEPGTLGRFQTYASSDFADSAKRPKLVIDWQTCNVGINELSNSVDAIALYPNPATGATEITLRTNEPIKQVVIRDLSGREITRISGVAENQVTFSTENLSSGLYLVEVWNTQDKMIGVKKLVLNN
jgi:hypothetical protein